ncbi:MAG: hypothetical protein H6Q73_920 [Firmicutes bacterium]|nr:hypothetical protein [Bacillota bacterium]
MRSSVWPLQVAIYDRLTAQISNYGIYDKVPDNEPDAYITIGEFDFNDWSTMTTSGMEITHTVFCWSKYSGTKEVCAMLDAVTAALSDYLPDLSADNFKVVVTKKTESGKIARYERDGLVYRYGSIAFKYKIQDMG